MKNKFDFFFKGSKEEFTIETNLSLSEINSRLANIFNQEFNSDRPKKRLISSKSSEYEYELKLESDDNYGGLAEVLNGTLSLAKSGNNFTTVLKRKKSGKSEVLTLLGIFVGSFIFAFGLKFNSSVMIGMLIAAIIWGYSIVKSYLLSIDCYDYVKKRLSEINNPSSSD